MSDRPQDLHEEVANSALHGAALVGACLAVPQLLLTFPRRERAPLYAAVCAALVALWNPAYLWHVFFWQR